MTHKSLVLLLAATTLLPLTATACQPGKTPPTTEVTSQPSPTPTPAMAQESPSQATDESQLPSATPAHQTPTPIPQPTQGGQVVVGGLGRPNNLNPLLAESQSARALIPLLFDSLLSVDPNSGALQPHLAERWYVSDDGLSITLTLRTDVRWHDGQPLTADDVVFSIEAARDPTLDSVVGPQLTHITQATASDNNTVVIALDSPHCPSLFALAELPILPSHLLAESEMSGLPLGSGPFVFIDWTPEGQVHLARNADYWGTVPYLDALSYYPFETITDLERALEEGQIDVALIPASHTRALSAADTQTEKTVFHYPSSEFLFVAFNTDHPILGDRRIRQALSMALDRQQLLNQALEGKADLIAGSLPPWHWAADPTLPPPDYDPDGARQLLTQAGWTDSNGDGWLDRDGERLVLPVRTNGGNPLREDLTTLIASYYRAIGIDATAEFVIWGAVVDDLFTHDFEIMVFSWPFNAEPDQSQFWMSTEDEMGSGYNFVSFANSEVDRLLQEASSVTGCDPIQRAERYQQVQRVLAEERPYDFLLVPYASVLIRPGVNGLTAGPFAHPLTSAASWYTTD